MKKILYFTATWCGPCTYVKPQLQEASNQIPISFIDVDSNTTTTEKYNIKNIPAVVLIDNNGRELGRLVGSNVTKQSVIDLYNK
ncbi:thioredoxin [uncultured Caudovirales phage]|uniref:Thioredoxin n=1 Tax=uncultured Caudovirales phage TaxID=2100421 RepID=A0A6J5NLX2_9CAUD|nr:thioredoxin [uncultured Caudovirales phage]